MNRSILNFEDKLCHPAQIEAACRELQSPMVFTNGCFDILHRGHVAYLAEARTHGASLIVALNTDDSVRRLNKGSDRPINRLEDRLAVIAALACVDLVTWFDEDTPLSVLLDCRPDILIKGGDWPVEQIVGASEVRAWGGRVCSIPIRYPLSTTALLQRIRQLSAD